jgi:ubiquinone/menaquinone biosynthesis C-methylase UbiE
MEWLTGERMKLNAVETALVNNPMRALVQRVYEGPLLRRLGGSLEGALVLEVGCGRGTGARILLEQFGVGKICAIDLDPQQVRRAKRRLTGYGGARVAFAAGSVERLPYPDECFDAVFDFGVLHHVPVWQAAITEIRRVLKPGGRFFFEEVTRAALNRWLYQMLLKHPAENRFSEAEFVAELAANGIELVSEPRRIFANDIFIGVGRLHADANPVPILNALLQDFPVLGNLDVPLGADQKQSAVIPEVAIPFGYLVVAPGGRVLPHLVVRHPVEIGAQVYAGFVGRLVRLLLEVPFHKAHDNVVTCPPCTSSRRNSLPPPCQMAGARRVGYTSPAIVCRSTRVEQLFANKSVDIDFAKECRDESRHGTQECVRHVGADFLKRSAR